MKLSEAIRIGCLLSGQIKHKMGDNTATCALGAAQLGLYGRVDQRLFPSGLTKEFPILRSRPKCPCECRPSSALHSLVRAIMPSMAGAIIHLNDDMGWSRERIADWVAKQEIIREQQNSKAAAVVQQEVPAQSAAIGQEDVAGDVAGGSSVVEEELVGS